MTWRDRDSPATTVEAVSERVRAAWDALDGTISGLTESQLTAPGRQGEWSIKDHLAHLTGWEQYLLSVLKREPGHEIFGVDQATFEALDTEGLNSQLYEHTRKRSLAEVLVARQRTHADVLAALAELGDSDLGRPMSEFWDDPADTRSLLWKIAGNTYEHYAEHQAWILAQLHD